MEAAWREEGRTGWGQRRDKPAFGAGGGFRAPTAQRHAQDAGERRPAIGAA
jgi:hypothetical protein